MADNDFREFVEEEEPLICRRTTSPFSYKCKICGLNYKERKWAEKCEKFCHDRKQCSPEIAKHAVT